MAGSDITANKYDPVALALHWLTALLVLALIGIGYGRGFFPRETARAMMDWHRMIGICVLAVVLFRLTWRTFIHRAPALPAMPGTMRMAAIGVHAMLYVMLLVMTLSGWAMTSARGRDVSLLSIIPLPRLVAESKAMGHQFETIHVFSVYVLLTLISVHVAGAVYHQYIRRDGLMSRMLPERWTRRL